VWLQDSRLLAIRGKAEVLVEERQDMILESVGDGAGVRAGVDLEAVRNPVVIQDVV
jgi:hypothetical protein